jgi:hypothetical protein
LAPKGPDTETTGGYGVVNTTPNVRRRPRNPKIGHDLDTIRRPSSHVLVLCIVWLLSAAYLFQSRAMVFFPLDEGLLAESARRVLSGQLPHRDFVDVYTGGLSALDAVAMRG